MLWNYDSLLFSLLSTITSCHILMTSRTWVIVGLLAARGAGVGAPTTLWSGQVGVQVGDAIVAVLLDTFALSLHSVTDLMAFSHYNGRSPLFTILVILRHLALICLSPRSPFLDNVHKLLKEVEEYNRNLQITFGDPKAPDMWLKWNTQRNGPVGLEQQKF